MQTILLTSSGKFLTDGDLSFLPKPIAEMKIAYITTAAKGVSDISYIERHRKRMKELNYNFEEIDIEGKNEQELKNILKNKEIIHIEGGNTFYLLKAVLDNGFDKVIKESIKDGIIYIGSSAGSYIACPTIEMATWKHQDRYDHYGVTDFAALNLVPFLVTAHYKPEYQELLKEKIQASKYPVRILTDEQAILIQNNEVQLVGNGKEINL